MADIVANTPEHYRQWPPQSLQLNALGMQVRLVYKTLPDVECALERGQLSDTNANLLITSEPADKVAVATEIAQFLNKLAKQRLPPKLARHALKHSLSYSKVQIRGQRTVWGSYSTSGTLSLNYKLLFLPGELVDYVLLHELAHTLCMDHSSAFWAHLEVLQPGARALDDQLAEAGREVPPWLELAR